MGPRNHPHPGPPPAGWEDGLTSVPRHHLNAVGAGGWTQCTCLCQSRNCPRRALWESRWGPEKGEERAAACVQGERDILRGNEKRCPGSGHEEGEGRLRQAPRASLVHPAAHSTQPRPHTGKETRALLSPAPAAGATLCSQQASSGKLTSLAAAETCGQRVLPPSAPRPQGNSGFCCSKIRMKGLPGQANNEDLRVMAVSHS